MKPNRSPDVSKSASPPRKVRPPVRIEPTPIPGRTSSAWWESGLQIGFNAVAALAALGSLLQLVPARSEDRAQLSELETAVSEQEVRVDRLRERFTYYFDPTQLESIVREEGQKIHPQQRPIVWIDAP